MKNVNYLLDFLPVCSQKKEVNENDISFISSESKMVEIEINTELVNKKLINLKN